MRPPCASGRKTWSVYGAHLLLLGRSTNAQDFPHYLPFAKTRDRLNDAPVRYGALMSYGPDQIEMFDPAADLLGKFTKEGADPANLLLET